MSVSVCQVQVHRSPYEGFLSMGATIPVGTALDSRKRTTSFSSPPRKRLHRTESYVDISFAVSGSSSSSSPSTSASASVPHPRSLRVYKEVNQRRRALIRQHAPILDPSPLFGSQRSCATRGTSAPVSPPPSLPSSAPRVTRQKTIPAPPPPPPPPVRTTPLSPLAIASPSSVIRCAVTPPPPVRAPIPVRSSRGSSSNSAAKANTSVRATSPPRTKPKSADLHRRAITACMRASPSGAKILHMGARLAVGIMSATRDLERLCSDGTDSSADAEGEDSSCGGILDEEMNLEDADAVGEDDDEDDIDAEGVEDDDIFSDDEGPLQMRSKPLGRVIVPAPSSAPAPALEPVAGEGEPMMDVQMPDAQTMSSSWIIVGEDWEMVEGA
ncbi:hypothetical protein C8R45DRAFT_467008 [Mycena sanguinolenta]|nr:hypothetical protein C8R45DRAFT_467008 [Mycena sanguinolenta]